MFNEAMSWGMLLPSLGNVNDYVMHIYGKYTDPEGKNRICASCVRHLINLIRL